MSLDQTSYRGRFAPSPTGPLHLGSLLTAWGSWLLARKAGGRWLVRIEDLDPPREVPGAAGLQLRTLAAFGLASDEPVVRQSERGPLYQAALDRLLDRGDAFHCHCSRRTLAANGGVHHQCVAAHAIDHPSVRFRVPPRTRLEFDDLIQGPVHQDVGSEVGDFVLRRADGPWAYQLAVVVDDAAQGITDVVRGADLLVSTPRQILLQRALGLSTPRHAHLPLLLDADGRKLSKSLACAPVDASDPLPALRVVWAALGQDPSAHAGAASVAAMLSMAQREFDPSRIPGQPVAMPSLPDTSVTRRP
ncbi:tRNA glutamyl-Q(34) synthetase GluQRS [Cognatiluteimonas profundi]|uniref:tRNA glutamyl-Q(34) synthetase GluQRS n=1 Tax=Cognatiluteimonas profundi TaxID=2594501 RepID=UPI00131E3502|nr:tRNA glutamyl-Q(34) synthetase GluQRS [Lysobacter profundi]